MPKKKRKIRSFKNRALLWQHEIAALLNRCTTHVTYKGRPMGQAGSDIEDPYAEYPLHALPWSYIEARRLDKYPSINALVKEMQKKGGKDWCVAIKPHQAVGPPIFIINSPLFAKLMAWWLRPNHQNSDLLRAHRKNACLHVLKRL